MFVRCESCSEKYRDVDPSTGDAHVHVCPNADPGPTAAATPSKRRRGATPTPKRKGSGAKPRGIGLG